MNAHAIDNGIDVSTVVSMLKDLMSLDSRLLLCTYEKAQSFINESRQSYSRSESREVPPQIRQTGRYVANSTSQSSQPSTVVSTLRPLLPTTHTVVAWKLAHKPKR